MSEFDLTSTCGGELERLRAIGLDGDSLEWAQGTRRARKVRWIDPKDTLPEVTTVRGRWSSSTQAKVPNPPRRSADA